MKREINTKETIRVATGNDFITTKGLEKLSLKARKLLYLAVAQCRKNDKELYEYVISVKEFAQLMGVNASHVYQEADSITDELFDIRVEYKNEKEKKFKKRHLFDKCDYDKNTGIYFGLHKDLEELYLNLKGNFTQPLLQDFMRMKKTYSMAIWHLCQREMQSQKPAVTEEITFDLDLAELREVTGTTLVKTYDKISHFKEKIFDKALKEIEQNCCVSITYTNIKRGRTIVGFKCVATNIMHFTPTPEIIEKGKRIRKMMEEKGECI